MPLLGQAMSDRDRAFQTLKPQCVRLSQAALALNSPSGKSQLVTQQLDELQTTLTKLTANPYALDPKLADYVFFPLSQVLKLSNRLPIRSLELSLQCIAILVSRGWRTQIVPQLAAQIMILCTLVAPKKPTGFAFTESTDELQTAAFSCLQSVFEAAAGSVECKAHLTSEANFPQLGQTITVLLDGIHDGASAEPQVAATEALRALVEGVAGREINASFLPGIVSKLAKVLTPSTKQRRDRRVLIGCLSVLSTLLRTTMGDEPAVQWTGMGETKGGSIITEQWKETAATQLKPALTSVMRLQSHNRQDVKEALAKLCLILLEHCRQSLANCSSLALETLLTLSVPKPDGPLRLQLELLLRGDPSLSGLLQTTVYDWLQSLPTIMQGADEEKKIGKMQQISTAYGLLVDSGVDTAVIDRMLAGILRDSLVITLQPPDAKKGVAQSFISPVQSLDLTVLDETKCNVDFGQPLVRYRGQEEIMASIDGFACLVSKSSSSSAFAADLARSLRYSEGETQIATFSLLLTATQTALQRKDNVDDFLDFGDQPPTGYTDYLEDLYAFALTILNTSSDDDPPDQRLQALALRTLALRAQIAGRDFRAELIDALYPVLSTLATPTPSLQTDSIKTLNIFASACDYASVRELIVENVDYLTNAVALKLNNSFDLSPQAPQVLLMMVRLAGPSLVPYLEDVVESMFAVLEGWHGYGVLVELLFKVLSVVAEEGVKAPALGGGLRRLEGVVVMEDVWRPVGVEGLVELLRERRVDERLAGEREEHPRRPWGKNGKGGVEDVDAESTEQNDAEHDGLADTDGQHDHEEPPPPAPKIYGLLLKITELTQHFLPSASPSLRTNLLSLIRNTVPALARHENSFLPLINTLWPEIVSRLENEEAHVQAAALEIVGVLCEEAGGFMRSRIVQLWPAVVEMYAEVAKEVIAGDKAVKHEQRRLPNSGDTAGIVPFDAQRRLRLAISRLQASPADYTNTSTRLMWEALISCLTAIVRSVPLAPDIFDEALEMLDPVLDGEDVREALEKANVDAVWLARVKRGALVPSLAPSVPDGESWKFASLPITVAG